MGRVVVIGLGAMGLGAAQSLHRAGLNVVGVDVTEATRARFAESGAEAMESPLEAARGADAVVVLVVNAAQTREVLFGDRGAATALGKGSVVISCATMSPQDARALASECRDRGLHYLDAPVSGGSVRAAEGSLTVMASGTPEAFDAAADVLAAMAATTYHLGDEAGIGSSFKIVNQLLAGVHIAAACEAITFAAKLGLDLAKVYEVITKSAGNSWMFENRIPHVLADDYTPKSAVNIFTKDLGIVAAIGQREQFPLPIASLALQLFTATAASGMGKDDDSSVARFMASAGGVTLPKKDR